MASKRIKGITIQIGADTKELTKAISDAEKQIGDAAYKMRDINKLLKADPKNVELLTQKQKAFTEAIEGTKKKLEQEKEALRQLGEKDQTDDVLRQQDALQREIAETEQKLESLEREYKEFGSVAQQQSKIAAQEMQNTGQKLQEVGQGISSVGRGMTQYVTAPIVAGFTASTKAAIDWETAFTGVKKTVDGTDEEYEQLADAIKEMSTEMASSKTEIAGVMEAAGQLGVTGVDNLIAFTRTCVMLGDTTNINAQDAAIALARVLNITGDGYDKISNMGSAVVALGNNMATSESEIVNMTTRLASAGKISGLTTQEILALSASMSSVGIEAEAGGTAMTQTFKGIQAAVSGAAAGKDGAIEQLRQLAEISGMTSKQFSEAWQDRPMTALTAFIQGLSKLKDEGGDTFAVLDELGMSGVRQSNMIQSLALATEQLQKATGIANTGWSENTALSEEAEKRYATMAAKLTQLKESLSNLAITVGERLMPYLEKLIEYVDELITKFEGLSDEEIDAAIKIAGFAAAVGPVLLVIGGITTAIGKFVWALGTIKGAFAAGGVFAGAGEAFAGIGAGISGLLGPIAAVAFAVAVWVKNWNEIQEAGQLLVERTKEHLEQIKADWIAVTDAIAEYVPAKWAEIKEKFSMFMEGMKIGAQIAWDFIKGQFQEKIDFIKGLVDGGFGFIEETIRTRIENARSEIETKLNLIKTIFEGIAEGAKLWGEHLIQNFIDGIKSKFSLISTVMSGVGKTIASYIHFSEPDVGPLSNFNSWMPDMMKQMAQQINAGIPGVESAMQNVAGSMRGEMAPDYSGQLASINNGIGQLAAAGGGNITVPVYIGQQKFAQAVVDANRINNYRNGGR